MYDVDMEDYITRRQHIAIEPAMEARLAEYDLGTYRIRQAAKTGEISQKEADYTLKTLPMASFLKSDMVPVEEKVVIKEESKAPGIVGKAPGAVGKSIGLGGIAIIVILAIGYLLIWGKKK